MASGPQKITAILTGLLLFLTLNSTAQLDASILAWDGTNATKGTLPVTLTATGFDASKTTVFVPYDVNVPQTVNFYQIKHYAYVSGTAITLTDSVDCNFPKGVVLMRHIFLDTIYGNPASRINIEFQMQVRVTDSSWAPLVYVWDLDGTEAHLLNSNPLFPYRALYPDFTAAPFTFHWPEQDPKPVSWAEAIFTRTEQDCAFCHFEGKTSNGFSVQQLNMDSQLQDLVTAGILTQLPDLAAMTAAGKVTKFSNWDDAAATLEQKVLSYVSANCFNCHNTDQEEPQTGMVAMFPHFTVIPSSAILDSMKNWDIVTPGNPDSSLLYTQINDVIMPQNSGVSQPDPIALKNIWDWISALDGTPEPFSEINSKGTILETLPPNAIGDYSRTGGSSLSASFYQQTLIVNSMADNGVVKLFDLKGKEMKLIKINPTNYAVGDGLNAGLYVLKTENGSIPVLYNPI